MAYYAKTYGLSLDIDNCEPNQCQNGGTCLDRLNSHYCICAPGYEGFNCEKSNDVIQSRLIESIGKI